MVVLPNLHKVFLLTSGIQELVLSEEPELQVLGHLFIIRGYGGTGVRRCEITICLRSILVPPYLRPPVPPKQLRYFPFLGFEITVRLLGIVDGWHEVRPVVASFQQSRVGCEEAPLYDENAKHFAF